MAVIKENISKSKPKKGICVFLAVIYTAVLIYIVMLKNSGVPVRAIQPIPFYWLYGYLSGEKTLLATLKNVLGNILLFIPPGIILPLISDKMTLKKCVAAGFVLSLCAETAQYIFCLGMSDIDDLITNTLGALAGAGIYYGVFCRFKGGSTTVIIFLLVFGVLGSVSVWYYQPDLILGKIPYHGDSIAGVSMDSYDISAICYKISYGGVFLTADPEKISDPERSVDVKDVYLFTDDTVFIIYGGGAYRAVNRADLTERIKLDGKANVCIWLDRDGKCKMLLYNG